MFHTIVQETIATKEFEAEKKQENETRWMEIRAMEMHKVVIEEKLRVLEEELQMKKVEQKNAGLCSWTLLGLMKHKRPMFCQCMLKFWRRRWEGVAVEWKCKGLLICICIFRNRMPCLATNFGSKITLICTLNKWQHSEPILELAYCWLLRTICF